MKGPLKKLLVVVNGAESSILAAKYAIALAKSYGASVTAAYTVDTATIRQLSMSRIFVDEESAEYERSLEETGKRYLAFVEELAKAKGQSVSTLLLKGSIAGEIVKAAEEIGADCIVIGGGERDSSYRDVIVEANREIARLSTCPILGVKGAAAEAAYKSL
ncbi:MAG: universal stress protein [Spirochaetaceae bacterium]|nr:universal stress protein [Spirochaetaceae bacterium]